MLAANDKLQTRSTATSQSLSNETEFINNKTENNLYMTESPLQNCRVHS